MNFIKLTCFALLALCSSFAFAAESKASDGAKSLKSDTRIRVVSYDRDAITTLYGYFGYVTLVELEPDEEIDEKKSRIGFPATWEVAMLENMFTIKPHWDRHEKGPDGKEVDTPFPVNADSNLLVVTDKRRYFFNLRCLNRCIAKTDEPKEMTYALRFSYPAPQLVASEEASGKARNYRYSAQSMPHTEVEDPANVWDDGTFTFLRFYKLQEIPAVFVVNPDGTESAIDTNVQNGDTIVVPRVAMKLILRKGDKYATLILREDPLERAFGTNTGTSDPNLEKKVRK